VVVQVGAARRTGSQMLVKHFPFGVRQALVDVTPELFFVQMLGHCIPSDLSL
jgi:hypothetical protein